MTSINVVGKKGKSIIRCSCEDGTVFRRHTDQIRPRNREKDTEGQNNEEQCTTAIDEFITIKEEEAQGLRRSPRASKSPERFGYNKLSETKWRNKF